MMDWAPGTGSTVERGAPAGRAGRRRRAGSAAALGSAAAPEADEDPVAEQRAARDSRCGDQAGGGSGGPAGRDWQCRPVGRGHGAGRFPAPGYMFTTSGSRSGRRPGSTAAAPGPRPGTPGDSRGASARRRWAGCRARAPAPGGDHHREGERGGLHRGGQGAPGATARRYSGPGPPATTMASPAAAPGERGGVREQRPHVELPRSSTKKPGPGPYPWPGSSPGRLWLGRASTGDADDHTADERAEQRVHAELVSQRGEDQQGDERGPPAAEVSRRSPRGTPIHRGPPQALSAAPDHRGGAMAST